MTFEHKIGIFVRFWGLEPPFSGVSSTKSRFLCFLPFGTLIFRVFEHRIGVFVLKRRGKWDRKA